MSQKNKEAAKELPNDTRNWRACLFCKLIKSEDQFENDGCGNCEGFLKLAKKKAVQAYTSVNFEGFIGMVDPKESWVAKWQRLVKLKPAIYAIKVNGEVADWLQELKTQE